MNGDLTLAVISGASGTYNLSGTGSLTVSGNEIIGENGSGAFTQSGGTNTTASLILGDQTSGNGTYTLSGTGSLAVG